MIKPGDILPDHLMVMPETGEIVPVPVPGQYTPEGVPYWEFGPGEVFPMTGEVIADDCPIPARIYCFAEHLQKPPLKQCSKNWFVRSVRFLTRLQ